MAKKKTTKKKVAKKKVRITPKKATNKKDVNKLTGPKPVPRVVMQVLSYGHKLSELGFANTKLTAKAQKLAGQLAKFAEQIGATLDADAQKAVKAKIKADNKEKRDVAANVKAVAKATRQKDREAKQTIRDEAKAARAEAKTAKKVAKLKEYKTRLAEIEAELNDIDPSGKLVENLKAN